MAEIGEEREDPRPNIWETLSSTQESQPENNNGWNQSEGWGKSLNNDTEWKPDGQDSSSGQKEPFPHTKNRFSRCRRSRNVRSSRSPEGDLRQLIDRGANRREESLTLAHFCGNAPRYRESCGDPWRGSCSNGKKEASTSSRLSAPCSRREACQPGWGKRGELSAWKQTGHPASTGSHFNENNWAGKNPGNERSTYSLKADVSKSQGISPVCNNTTVVENENQPGLSAPHNKLPVLSDENRRNGWDRHSALGAQSRSRSPSPFLQAIQEVKKSNVEKESDGWGLSSSDVDQSRLRSLSPWSQAAHNIKEKSDSKDTDGWGKALHQPDLDAWNRAKSSDLSPNCGSSRWRGVHSASQPRDKSIATEGKWERTERDRRYSPEHKCGKTRQHLDRSRCRDLSFSPEKRPSRTEWGRDRSRRRARSGLRSPSRFNRNDGMSPTDTNKTKDEREKKLACSSPIRSCSDLNEKTGSDRCGLTSPNVDSFRSKTTSQWSQVAQESTQDASQKEPDGWGQNCLPVKTSRSRSVSPWSQAAADIKKNYNNKETDGWGTALDQTVRDAWNQPRSNLSPDRGFKRSGEWDSWAECHSAAPKWGRTGQDLDRPRGRENSYSPDSRQRRYGRIQGGSRYRGRGRTNSPYRCQNGSRRSPNLQSRERKRPSYNRIGRSRRSPNLQRSPSCVHRMDENNKRNGSEFKYHNKTNDEDNAAKVTSWEGAKWHDGSVNAFRSSVNDLNLSFNWGGPTNTGDGINSSANHAMTPHPERVLPSSTKWTVAGGGGNSMALADGDCKTKQRGIVLEETFSQDLLIASQTSGDVKVVKNSPGVEHSMNGAGYLPLSYDPWDNDACIASSHATSTLPAASQTLSNQQNHILVSSLASNIFQTVPWSSSTNMLQESSNSTWGPSTALFKYPTLEPKTHIANDSIFSNCDGTKSNLVPIVCSSPHISMLNPPIVSNGTNGVTTPATSAHFVADLPPLISSGGINSSTPSAFPEARFSNSDAAMELALCTDTMKNTSYFRGTGTEDELTASNPEGHTSVDPVIAMFRKPNTDTVLQPISCTDMQGTSRATGSETKSELSAANPMDPTPEIPKLGLLQLNQNPTMENRMAARERTGEVDNRNFQWALIGFAKPKLRRFWLERHLTDANYREVLDKFVKNVTRAVGTTAPQTYENSCKYVKKQDGSLSNLLKDYLSRYMHEDVINNMRYGRRNEMSLVFPKQPS